MIGNWGENFSEKRAFSMYFQKKISKQGLQTFHFRESRKIQSLSLFPFTNQISSFQHRRNGRRFFMLKLDKYSLRWNYWFRIQCVTIFRILTECNRYLSSFTDCSENSVPSNMKLMRKCLKSSTRIRWLMLITTVMKSAVCSNPVLKSSSISGSSLILNSMSHALAWLFLLLTQTEEFFLSPN